MACCWVAMEVNAAGEFEGAMQFDKAGSHHGEIGKHVVGAEKFSEGLHHVGDATASLDDFLVHGGGELVPLPRVLEGSELRGRAGAIFFGEEDVVILIAFEWRVEINEVNSLVFDIAAENFEVIAVVKMVHSLVSYQKESGTRDE